MTYMPMDEEYRKFRKRELMKSMRDRAEEAEEVPFEVIEEDKESEE